MRDALSANPDLTIWSGFLNFIYIGIESSPLHHASRVKERRPTQSLELVCLAGLLVFVFLSGFFQVSDCDVGYHLRTAAHILAGKGIPTTNTFSWSTPEHPWLLHQWVGTIIFYLAFALGGVASLITFKAFVCALIMLLAWCSARMMARPGSWWPFWVVTAGTLAARARFFERPDLLSALFFALLLYLDGKWDKNRRWQWIGLPLLMAAWANTHAGVIYGFAFLAVVVGADCLEIAYEAQGKRGGSGSGQNWPEGLKRCLVRPTGFVLSLLLACATVQVINPNGCRVLWFPISQFTSKFWQSIILEYQPPMWTGAKAFYLFFVGLVVLQAFTVRRAKWRLLLVSVAFGYLACRSQRSLLFFVIAAVPHAVYVLDCLWPNLEETVSARPGSIPEPALVPAQTAPGGPPELSKVVGNKGVVGSLTSSASWKCWELAGLVATWLLAVLLLFVPDRTFRFGVGWYHPYYPVEIYQFVAKEVTPQGVFNEMRYGGSILWWLYPRFKPFIDGRGDAYSEQFWLKDYLPVLEGKNGWRDVLKSYDLHCVLLPLPESGDPLPLAQTLLSDPQWALVAFNDFALLFLERTQTNLAVIAQHEFKILRPGNWSFEWVDAADKRDQGAVEIMRALALSPDSRFGRTARARMLMSAGQFDEAAEELLQILGAYPEAGGLYWRDYGYALCRIGRLAEADQVFSKMIKKHQLVSYACFMKYHIALERHDFATADQFLSRALQLEPSNPDYCLARTNLDQAMKLRQ